MMAAPRNDHVARLSAWIGGGVAAYLVNFQLHDVVFHDFPHSQRQSREKDTVIAQLVALLDEERAASIWTVPQSRAVAFVLFDAAYCPACFRACSRPGPSNRKTF